ncbi:hypothetical protein BJ742DRAFT_835817 [Cladochytrium replicatum]|nr:hypothetical protein BJ742DRAFT_835817 [Cladochytrium replicatum]
MMNKDAPKFPSSSDPPPPAYSAVPVSANAPAVAAESRSVQPGLSTGWKIVLFFLGLFLSWLGIFIFCCVCLMEAPRRVPFYTGTAFGFLIISVAIFVQGGIVDPDLCNAQSFNSVGVDTSDPDYTKALIQGCRQYLVLARSIYFAIAAFYGLCMVVSLSISGVSSRRVARSSTV